MPPSVLLADGDGTWTDKDRLLVVALGIHERGLCRGCEQPARLTHDINMSGWFEVGTDVCLGCEVLDAHRESTKNNTHLPGLKVFVFNSRTLDAIRAE